MPSPKLKNLFVSETCLRLCAIDLQISFIALAIASKKYPKASVKLAQSGCYLAQSVKLGVMLFKNIRFWYKIQYFLAIFGKIWLLVISSSCHTGCVVQTDKDVWICCFTTIPIYYKLFNAWQHFKLVFLNGLFSKLLYQANNNIFFNKICEKCLSSIRSKDSNSRPLKYLSRLITIRNT